MEGDIEPKEKKTESSSIDSLYKEWFLDYASYVILDRAIPQIDDGLKPVQRRILHALEEMDDGRYNKVANVIGHTMQYHPHGDASIEAAMVQLGQKDILIDTQGNWGDVFTGDPAAAARYIEARLSSFAKEILFNKKTTQWVTSYDGRNKEPLVLPAKFPLMLLMGVEGIAVGLATKILPHNFNELIEACIAVLENKNFSLYPDFMTGGIMDVSDYKEGKKGGRIKIRAKIEKEGKTTLVIREIPYGTTTPSLIESIISATNKGVVKIKKIDDNTTSNVNIRLELQQGVGLEKTIKGLYRYTNCQTSVACNCCVIIGNKPKFISIHEALKHSTLKTKELLNEELAIALSELKEKKFYLTMEKIFIDEKFYKYLENVGSQGAAVLVLESAFKPFLHFFQRTITPEDYLKLLEIKMKKITRYDRNRTENDIAIIEENILSVVEKINNLTSHTISFFQHLKQKYGKDRQRKTSLEIFDPIELSEVLFKNKKLYINKKEGFIGTELKNDEFLFSCSAVDDIIVFFKDGTYQVVKVGGKLFVGKHIYYVSVFDKKQEEKIYYLIYTHPSNAKSYAKKFKIKGLTRNKKYSMGNVIAPLKIVFFQVFNEEIPLQVKILFKPVPRMKVKEKVFDFSSITVKGKGVKGNTVANKPIQAVKRMLFGI